MLIPFRYQGGAFEIVNTPAPLTSARQKRTRLFFQFEDLIRSTFPSRVYSWNNLFDIELLEVVVDYPISIYTYTYYTLHYRSAYERDTEL